MRRIICQSCGAEGAEGSICAYCGSHLTISDIQDADAVGSGVRVSGKTILLVETLSHREEVEKNVRESLSYMAEVYTRYISSYPDISGLAGKGCSEPLPYDINPETFNMGSVRKVYLPFYSFERRYEGIWVDKENKSGSFFGSHTLMTPAFKPSGKKYIPFFENYGKHHRSFNEEFFLAEERGILRSSLKDLRKTGEEIQPVTLRPDERKQTKERERLRRILSEADAKVLLDGEKYDLETSLKAVQAKFGDEKCEIAYVSYWLVPVSISGVTKEYLIGAHACGTCSILSLNLAVPFPVKSCVNLDNRYIPSMWKDVRDCLGRFLMGEDKYENWCRLNEEKELKKELLNHIADYMDDATIEYYRTQLTYLAGEKKCEQWFEWFEKERERCLKNLPRPTILSCVKKVASQILEYLTT